MVTLYKYPKSPAIKKLTENKKPVLQAIGTLTENHFGINLSSIATKLINEVGRCAEQYASDFLINWKTVEDFTTLHDLEEPEEIYVTFAIRKSGVDGNGFFTSRIKNHIEWYPFPNTYGYLNCDPPYRKVWIIKIENLPKTNYSEKPECTVSLYDVTDNTIRITEEDLIMEDQK